MAAGSIRRPGAHAAVAYVGIGYSGPDDSFLHEQVDKHIEWLRADRLPRFYGGRFLVLYDSNTAREFVKKCRKAAGDGALTVYPMDRPYEP
jgi:hypothetical protein